MDLYWFTRLYWRWRNRHNRQLSVFNLKESDLSLRDVFLLKHFGKQEFHPHDYFKGWGLTVYEINAILEELRDDGHLVLRVQKNSRNEQIYTSRITNKGVLFINRKGGYTLKHKERNKKEKWERWKEWAIFFNALLTLVLMGLGIYFQVALNTAEKDRDEYKKRLDVLEIKLNEYKMNFPRK